MAKPGVPVPTQTSVAQGYVVGDPNRRPKTSTLALAPDIGGIGQGKLPVLVGVDMQSGSVAYTGGLATFTIPLPNLPAPFTVGPSDKAQLIVALMSFAFPFGTPDHAVSVVLTPQALNGTTPIVTAAGGILRQGQTYTGWQVVVNAYSDQSTAGTLTVGVSAWIYDSPLIQQ